MSLSNLKTKENIVLDSDRTGGFRTLETDIYGLNIKFAYFGKSKGGAMSLNLETETTGGAKLSQQIWITSGDKKGNSNVYKDKDGNEQYLPGFVVANSLCLLALKGQEIADVSVEEKTINIYDFTAKKDLPTKVDMLVDLIGVDIRAAVQKQLVDKNAKDGNGVYQPTGETREQNEIIKFFKNDNNMTVTEITAQAEEALHHDKWLETNKGNVFDKSTKTGATGGAPNKPAGNKAAGAEPKKSLFA